MSWLRVSPQDLGVLVPLVLGAGYLYKLYYVDSRRTPSAAQTTGENKGEDVSGGRPSEKANQAEDGYDSDGSLADVLQAEREARAAAGPLSRFQQATEYVQQHHASIPTKTKLELYGLYKQATSGVCNKPQPSLFKATERSKWDSWNRLADMPKAEAETQYVQTVEAVCPAFRQASSGAGGAGAGAGAGASASAGSATAPDNKPAKKGSALSAPQSTLAAVVDDGNHDVFYHILQGNIAPLRAFLDRRGNVNARNENGETLLHVAVDANNASMVRLLLQSGADPNSKETEGGCTPLHYAAVAGAGLMETLVSCGAKLDIADAEGNLPLDDVDDAALRRKLQSLAKGS